MTVSTPTISPAELDDRIQAGEPVRILDIRDRPSVDKWRITGDSVAFAHVPRSKALQAKALGTEADLLADLEGQGPITVVCAEGRASAEVASFLAEAGYDARNLAEGMDGWGDLYRGRELDTGSSTRLLQYRRPSSGCLSYLLVSAGEAVVLDPLAAFTDRYVVDAESMDATLVYAVDTHVHADHVSGVRDLAAQSGATAVVPKGSRDRGVSYATETISDGETLSVGQSTATAIAAPGHTSDMTAFRVEDVLFTGDSLFVESVARPDLERDEDGAPALAQDLYETLLNRFGSLGDDLLVAPGHYGSAAVPAEDGTYAATLGELRRRLWAFDTTEETFVERILADLPPRPANYERIIAINLGQETVEEETALELELGPNNCAATPMS